MAVEHSLRVLCQKFHKVKLSCVWVYWSVLVFNGHGNIGIFSQLVTLFSGWCGKPDPHLRRKILPGVIHFWFYLPFSRATFHPRKRNMDTLTISIPQKSLPGRRQVPESSGNSVVLECCGLLSVLIDHDGDNCR